MNQCENALFATDVFETPAPCSAEGRHCIRGHINWLDLRELDLPVLLPTVLLLPEAAGRGLLEPGGSPGDVSVPPTIKDCDHRFYPA